MTLVGAMYGVGGLGLWIAGIFEMIIGNTVRLHRLFPFFRVFLLTILRIYFILVPGYCVSFERCTQTEVKLNPRLCAQLRVLRKLLDLLRGPASAQPRDRRCFRPRGSVSRRVSKKVKEFPPDDVFFATAEARLRTMPVSRYTWQVPLSIHTIFSFFYLV
jgi:hypothetical protein